LRLAARSGCLMKGAKAGECYKELPSRMKSWPSVVSKQYCISNFNFAIYSLFHAATKIANEMFIIMQTWVHNWSRPAGLIIFHKCRLVSYDQSVNLGSWPLFFCPSIERFGTKSVLAHDSCPTTVLRGPLFIKVLSVRSQKVATLHAEVLR
jgi:hypothetical protein